MNNMLRTAFATLTVAGALALGACQTTDDGMDDTDAPASAPAEPMSEPAPAAPMTPATPTDSSTVPATETPTDGTP